MTTDEPNLLPEEPTTPVPYPPAPPTPPVAAPAPSAGGSHLGHIVAGALLVLIGVGWLLEALDVADVPWRYLLPAALIIVGVALVFGAQTGAHGGLIAVGVILSVLVLLAGALDVLADIPLSGGVGEESHRPTGTVADEYRWGVGKMTLDLRSADVLAGESIEASVIIGELLVLVPPDTTLVVDAQSGIGEVIVLSENADGLDADLHCAVDAAGIDCADDADRAEPVLRLDLRVAIGKVEVQG